MKILIVQPSGALEPVGLSYIVASLKKAGHDVDCLNRMENHTLAGVLGKRQFDFVATGGLASQYKSIRKIVCTAKRSGMKVLLGGGMVTSEPELITRALQSDYSVIGEGEESVVELLRCLENNGKVESVAGIAFLNGGKFVKTSERKSLADINSLPLPDWDAFNLGKHLDTLKSSDEYFYDIFDHPRVYPLISSRSCPFLCTFCYHPLGQKYRKRTVDSIMEELETAIPKYRINIVAIYDELFTYDEKRLYEFCTRFRKFTALLPWEVTWNCQMRVDKLDEKMLTAMKESGCSMVSYGFESYSEKVLKSMKKYITPEQIHRAIHMTLDKKISIQGNFIFGDIAETRETASVTLAFWKEHSFSGILLSFIFPCPDSFLYRYCLEKGIIRDRLHYIEDHFFDTYNMTQMKNDDFYRLRSEVIKYGLKYYPWSVPSSVKSDSMTVVCPHCKQTIQYKNFSVTENNAAIYGLRPGRYLFNKMMYCRNCRHRFFAVSKLYRFYSKIMLHLLSPTVLKIYEKTRHFLSRFTLQRKNPRE